MVGYRSAVRINISAFLIMLVVGMSMAQLSSELLLVNGWTILFFGFLLTDVLILSYPAADCVLRGSYAPQCHFDIRRRMVGGLLNV